MNKDIVYKWSDQGGLTLWRVTADTPKQLRLERVTSVGLTGTTYRLHKNELNKGQWGGGLWTFDAKTMLAHIEVRYKQGLADWQKFEDRSNKALVELHK